MLDESGIHVSVSFRIDVTKHFLNMSFHKLVQRVRNKNLCETSESNMDSTEKVTDAVDGGTPVKGRRFNAVVKKVVKMNTSFLLS